MSNSETTADNEANETVESIEESPTSETGESEDSEAENPTAETKKKRFSYMWIFITSALILIALFFAFFNNLYSFYSNNESRIYISGSLLVALVIGLLVWYVPKRQIKILQEEIDETKFDRAKERIKLEDDTRKTLAQIIGGVFLIAGLFVTYNTYRLGIDNYRLGLEQQKISQKQQELSIEKGDLDRRGQITERFNKAVEHLANQDLAVRLGGLYALEQILRDSPEEHQTIIEVLSAYIRQHSINKIEQNKTSRLDAVNQVIKQNNGISTDVQTAVIIIGRRPRAENRKENNINLENVDLNYTDFNGIDLSSVNFGENQTVTILKYANLSRANFISANLNGVYLRYADLRHADFTNAKLNNARIDSAKLNDADFTEADLSGVNLNNADLSGADFDNTNLSRANLKGAELSEVKHLSSAQLKNTEFEFIYINKEKFDKESALKYFREKEGLNKE